MGNRELDVYLDVDGHPLLAGHAWFTQRRGGPVSTVFAYSANYLARPNVIAIDPNLSLVTGNQYVDGLPGSFQDCAPDRWGRNLIDKRHRQSESDSRQGDLNAVDYLTEVSDLTRQGALRFTDPSTHAFVHPNTEVPKLIQLPRLLQASHSISAGSDDFAAVKDLLDAGSGSLGGARPKASVLGHDGELLIAKFPHHEDEWDVMAWECVALDLAAKAGIDVPERDLISVAETQRVLLLRRFDRTEDGHRLPYISAMTALSAKDGQWHDYTEIAEAITGIGSRATHDLHQLFRRVVFAVAVHNTDDHLRNHGFLAAPGGWTLSPMFDVNPNPNPNSGRVTGIAGASTRSEEHSGLDALAMSCRLTPEQVQEIRTDVGVAVAGWREAATKRGIANAELAQFSDSFEHPASR